MFAVDDKPRALSEACEEVLEKTFEAGKKIVSGPEGITFFPNSLKKEYFIEHDRIDTPEKILKWICHLSQKNWFKDEYLFHVFLSVATNRIGIDVEDMGDV